MSRSFLARGKSICGPRYGFSGPVIPSSVCSSDSSENLISIASARAGSKNDYMVIVYKTVQLESRIKIPVVLDAPKVTNF